MQVEIRNIAFNRKGGIDCEVNHPVFGWMPFAADPNDPEAHGRAIYAAALALNPAQYIAPPPDDPRPSASMPRADFCKALRREGILPANEAVIAAQGGWPDTFAGFVSGLTADEAADAQIDWAAATEIRYSAPLLQALALAHAGGDQAAATAILDAIFGID